MGPYGKRRLMIPHGGQTTVFRDGDGNLYGTFGGARMAVFQDKPGIVALRYGYYYLVGTVAHMKMPNPEQPGIYAWRSKNLREWEDMGEIWNIASWKGAGAPYKPQPPRFAPHLPMNFEGIWSPRMSFVKGNYYIAWGPSYGGCYLLRSVSGRPEGPYEAIDYEFHAVGIAPNLLEDDDGSVYYICTGAISIAKMRDDMSGLAVSH